MQLSVMEVVQTGGLFILIFILIFLLAVATPKLAKFCDKYISKFFKKDATSQDDSIYQVRGIYDKPRENMMKENNKDGEEKNGEE